MKTFILLFSILFLSACSLLPPKKTSAPSPSPAPLIISSTPSALTKTMTQTQDTVVGLNTKNGQIVLRLYADKTPNTVANFLKKARSGFYDNLLFHRVIPGFMAQGGDPSGTGAGGARQKSELNQIPFKRGSLGLARTADTKELSSDSQFFICFTDEGCKHLTGDYVNFGEVISGFEVLDKIEQGDKIIKISADTK